MSHAMMGTVQQAGNVHVLLFQCWYIVYDVDPTLENILEVRYILNYVVKSNIFIAWCIPESIGSYTCDELRVVSFNDP